MKIKLIILLIASMMISLPADANSRFSEARISILTMHDFGDDILVTFSGPITTSEGCTINNQVALQKTRPFFKEMYSALLSAFHGNIKVAGWVNGCHAFGMPNLTRLDLVK